MNKKTNTLRKAVLAAMGVSAALAYSGQAAAIAPASLPVLTVGSSATVTGAAPKRAWTDVQTETNFGWTHTAIFRIFQVGDAADLLAGTRFNVNVDLKAQARTVPVGMDSPAFTIWTSGATPLVTGAANGAGYGHEWNQVRGGYGDGGIANDPCAVGEDCALGSNGWLGTGGGGNILDGHDGWIGYANAGYAFTNGDGDKIQGLYAGASNPDNIGLYGDATNEVGDPLTGTAVTHVNASSPYVNGGSATLSTGEAILNLSGLKAGYYLIGWGGACADGNDNGQGCGTAGARGYDLTISNAGISSVPLPGAVWLFGSALAGFTAFGRRKLAKT